jgi:hypothetical protein
MSDITREVVQVPEGTAMPYNVARELGEATYGGKVVFVYRLGPTWFAVSIRRGN